MHEYTIFTSLAVYRPECFLTASLQYSWTSFFFFLFFFLFPIFFFFCGPECFLNSQLTVQYRIAGDFLGKNIHGFRGLTLDHEYFTHE